MQLESTNEDILKGSIAINAEVKILISEDVDNVVDDGAYRNPMLEGLAPRVPPSSLLPPPTHLFLDSPLCP